MAQEGESTAQIIDTSTDAVNKAFLARAPDQQLLDEYACALTLIDQNETLYFGRTYLPLLTLPIPRQWWPEKPSLADYIADFSRPTRPMAEMGMVITFLGESYANFGYPGLLIVPYLLAYWLARSYFRAYRRNYFSVSRLVYLLVACNLIQVYRDGLTSIVVFTWVNMMPLMIIVALHYLFPMKPRKEKHKGYTSLDEGPVNSLIPREFL
jgi:hypothetical protein